MFCLKCVRSLAPLTPSSLFPLFMPLSLSLKPLFPGADFPALLYSSAPCDGTVLAPHARWPIVAAFCTAMLLLLLHSAALLPAQGRAFEAQDFGAGRFAVGAAVMAGR